MTEFLSETEWAVARPSAGQGGGCLGKGPPEAWFLFWGRREDKATAMGYTKDFQAPRVLGDLWLPWPGEGGSLSFKDLAASHVWLGAKFASKHLVRGGGARGGGGVGCPFLPKVKLTGGGGQRVGGWWLPGGSKCAKLLPALPRGAARGGIPSPVRSLLR